MISETQRFQEDLSAHGNRTGYIERVQWCKEELVKRKSKAEKMAFWKPHSKSRLLHTIL